MTASIPATPRRRVSSGGGLSSVVLVVVLVAVSLAAITGAKRVYENISRDPSGDGHTRVLFVGDSLMLGASDQLARTFKDAGAETRFIGAYSTGLLSGQGWWNREITVAVDDWHPDVVIVEACCNYGAGEPLFVMPDGATAASESEDMYTWWTTYAKETKERATANGAKLYWVTAPAASTTLWPLYEKRIPRFNDIIDELGIARIDWASAITPDGTFAPTIPVDGKPTKVRKDDGLHLTDAGNRVVVRVTYAAVKDDLGLV